ncbi:MAG: hypothetical protein M3063_05065, partial [Actinomycetota bacterium]|nr:hypothetical protein [Actinomycetota bacterium]
AGRLVPLSDAAALAGGVLALLAESGSSTASRRARPRLRSSGPGDFGAVFTAVAAGGRGYRLPR